MLFSSRRSTKRRISIGIEALLALMAIGGVFAGGAAASGLNWRIAGLSVAGPQETSGTSESLEISSKILGSPVDLACGATASGTITAGGEDESTIEFSKCAVTTPSACSATISPLHAHGKLIEAGGNYYDKLSPKAETEKFAELSITGCGAEGTYALKGTMAAVLNSSESPSQPFGFSSASSKATEAVSKLGKEVATVSGVLNQHLAHSSSVWGAGESGTGPTGPYVANIGVVAMTNGQSEFLSVAGGAMTFQTKVLGSEFVVACGSSQLTNASLKSTAEITGTLKLSECATTKPTGCTVASTWTTVPLVSAVTVTGTRLFHIFKPQSGETLVEIGVTGCAFEGIYPIKGSFAARGNQLGVGAVVQSFSLSASAQTESGALLKFSKETASLTGEMSGALSGANIGSEWSVW